MSKILSTQREKKCMTAIVLDVLDKSNNYILKDNTFVNKVFVHENKLFDAKGLTYSLQWTSNYFNYSACSLLRNKYNF